MRSCKTVANPAGDSLTEDSGLDSLTDHSVPRRVIFQESKENIMPDKDNTKLQVTLYALIESIEDDAQYLDEGTVLEPVDYVSLVSPETYGPPALVAPNPKSTARAAVGDTVLYINTGFVPVFEIKRITVA
jgi:hypothetical protein